MDFRRIEIIFLIVFIALDIFLFASYNHSRESVVMTGNNNTHTTIAKDMNRDNINGVKLSSKQGQGYYLSAKDNTVLKDDQNRLKDQAVSYNDGQGQLTSVLDEPVSIKDRSAVKTINKHLNKPSDVLYGNKYVYSKDLSSANTIVYVQKLDSGVVYDQSGRLEFQIVGNRIVSYTQNYIIKPSILREKQTTISAQKAVNNLYVNNEIPANSQIKWVNKAYAKLLRVEDSTIYIPVWYVGYTTKGTHSMQTRYVNAFSGAVIKDSSGQSRK